MTEMIAVVVEAAGVIRMHQGGHAVKVMVDDGGDGCGDDGDGGDGDSGVTSSD